MKAVFFLPNITSIIPKNIRTMLSTPMVKVRSSYKYGDEVVESYDGEFEVGQYSGWGRLEKSGKVYEGFFSDNKYLIGLEDED